VCVSVDEYVCSVSAHARYVCGCISMLCVVAHSCIMLTLLLYLGTYFLLIFQWLWTCMSIRMFVFKSLSWCWQYYSHLNVYVAYFGRTIFLSKQWSFIFPIDKILLCLLFLAQCTNFYLSSSHILLCIACTHMLEISYTIKMFTTLKESTKQKRKLFCDSRLNISEFIFYIVRTYNGHLVCMFVCWSEWYEWN
jgi:hypothetical protein